ncbi:hypothetical protein EYF80_011173 [Liparis tanakae]|uniref:Uncharacterized protein n=1 Tax=Liparis tanakae TaxID=230148 RepID=A0A4Z2ILH8_9TELE|nr:hypothetical protein EYF80_011173 [Liparis tanakae]
MSQAPRAGWAALPTEVCPDIPPPPSPSATEPKDRRAALVDIERPTASGSRASRRELGRGGGDFKYVTPVSSRGTGAANFHLTGSSSGSASESAEVYIEARRYQEPVRPHFGTWSL